MEDSPNPACSRRGSALPQPPPQRKCAPRLPASAPRERGWEERARGPRGPTGRRVPRGRRGRCQGPVQVQVPGRAGGGTEGDASGKQAPPEPRALLPEGPGGRGHLRGGAAAGGWRAAGTAGGAGGGWGEGPRGTARRGRRNSPPDSRARVGRGGSQPLCSPRALPPPRGPRAPAAGPAPWSWARSLSSPSVSLSPAPS